MQSPCSPLQSSMIGEFSRKFLRACALFRRCAAGIPDLAPVLDALSDVERRLEELGVEGRAILPGPVPSRIRANNALHNRVRYLQRKTRKLEGIVEKYAKEHSRALTTFWIAQAGLSDPRSSTRSVQSWCQDISWFRGWSEMVRGLDRAWVGGAHPGV